MQSLPPPPNQKLGCSCWISLSWIFSFLTAVTPPPSTWAKLQILSKDFPRSLYRSHRNGLPLRESSKNFWGPKKGPRPYALVSLLHSCDPLHNISKIRPTRVGSPKTNPESAPVEINLIRGHSGLIQSLIGVLEWSLVRNWNTSLCSEQNNIISSLKLEM